MQCSGMFCQQHCAALLQDPVEELVSSDTVVEIGMEDPAQALNVLSDGGFSNGQVAASDQEEADSAAQPAPADLPGEVAPSSDEDGLQRSTG